jgi:hypothetical protein
MVSIDHMVFVELSKVFSILAFIELRDLYDELYAITIRLCSTDSSFKLNYNLAKHILT